MAWSVPFHLLGLSLHGDLGGWSIYTDQGGRKIVFPKAPPEKPPTPEQLYHRNRFRIAQANWKALADDPKRDLEIACRSLNIPMTGQNLYISASLKHDVEAYETVSRQAAIMLPPLVLI